MRVRQFWWKWFKYIWANENSLGPFGPYWALGLKWAVMNSNDQERKSYFWSLRMRGKKKKKKKKKAVLERVFGEAKHWNLEVSTFFFFLPSSLHNILPMGTNAADVEKTEDDLRKEIDELQRQQREVLFLLHLHFSSFLFPWCIASFSDYRTPSWSSRTPERWISWTWPKKLRR